MLATSTLVEGTELVPDAWQRKTGSLGYGEQVAIRRRLLKRLVRVLCATADELNVRNAVEQGG